MAEFSPAVEIGKISGLVQEFIQHVLYDEEPLFIIDEAKIWDVSTSTPQVLIKRCSDYYGIPVSLEDLNQPLWKLLPLLSKKACRLRDGIGFDLRRVH
ncbi:MAG: hypothetical protein M3N41_00210 [Acidobacteriota bacterium]|nr:hypothetical protein [Acidobacteriota bacterium]